MKNSKWLVFVIIGVLIAGAIFLLWPGGDAAPVETEVAEEAVPPTEILETPAEVEVITETANVEEVVQSTATQAIPPTPRTGLESTDPASVNLASGDIQLIELFAFW